MSKSKNGSIVGTIKVPIRVLHVDDDPTFLDITRDILNGMGDFVIDHALCVEEALNKLRIENFDVVISDYDMPNKNGLDFLRELRGQKNTIPFMLFTGKGREDVAIKALNLGADGYYNKQGKTETVYGELTHGILLVSERIKVKTALAESEKRYRTIMEQAADVIFVHDNKGQIVDVNHAASRKLGYTRAEFLSMSIMDISTKATKNKLENLWPKIVAGKHITLEAIHKHKNGYMIPVEVTLGPLIIEKEIFLIGIVRDISERKKTEREQKILAGFLKIVNRNIKVQDLIKAAVYFFKEESGCEAVGIRIKSGEDYPYFQSGGFPDAFIKSENSLCTKDSGGKVLRDDIGNPVLDCMCGNVIQRRFDPSKEFFTENGSFWTNSTTRLLASTSESDRQARTRNRCNGEGYESVALIPLKNLGQNLGLIQLNDHRQGFFSLEKISLWERVARELSLALSRSLSEEALIQAKENLRISEGYLKEAHKVAHIGHWEWNIQTNDLMWGEEHYHIFGLLPQTDLSLDTFLKMIHPNDVALVKQSINEALKGKPYTLDFCIIRSDGAERIICGTGAVEYSLDGKPSRMFGTVQDITERKKAEQLLHRSEEKYLSLFDSTLDGIVIANNLAVVVSANKAAATMFGYNSSEELVNMPASLLYADPEDRRVLFENLTKKGSIKDYEVKLKRKDGKLFDAIVSVVFHKDLLNNILRTEVIIREKIKRKKDKDITEVKLAEMEMQFAANLFEIASDSILVHDLAGSIVFFNQAAHKLRGYSREEFRSLTISDLEAPGNVWDFKAKMKVLLDNGEGVFETYNLCKDKSVLLFEIHARVIELDGRKLVLSVARDISDRKRAEFKLAESGKRIELMNEKLHVSGSLARHDVRNKLSTVTGYAYLLKKKYPNEEDIIDTLGKMEQAISDSMRIFDFAKVYEQLGVEELVYVDVEKTVNEALALLSCFNLKVVNECQGLTLLADSFLRQLFYNLLDNTRKYGQKATTVRIYFERTESDVLKLIYEDNGVGVSKENKSRLFEEGFSTGNSTGFGLFLIKKMVDIYGWTIEETGEPGTGTQFTITIPKQENNTKLT
ncbi:MAG: PAS domain S-box protein [Candidatus Bathyarchaeota archaeon]|nr:PAS domain S-box protein [Candidatus Bathyarchaeota archaeon]